MHRARPIFVEVESGTSKGKFSIYISTLMYWIFVEDLSKTLFNTPYCTPHYINISYNTLMYWIVFLNSIPPTVNPHVFCMGVYGTHTFCMTPEYHPPLRNGKTPQKSARVIRVLRVSTWESASGCESGARSRTPKHVAVGAIPELRAPIFAGFFHVRGGWVINLTENGTSS